MFLSDVVAFLYLSEMRSDLVKANLFGVAENGTVSLAFGFGDPRGLVNHLSVEHYFYPARIAEID